jgi:hypothetical protein
MQLLAELIGAPLHWEQPKASKMEYELHGAESVVATLRFRSMFGSLATAESADGCWTFKRIGFWRPRVTVRVCGGETDIAMFTNHTWSNGGTLALPDGRTLLASTNLWATQYEIKTETDASLIHYKMHGFVRFGSDVTLQPAASGLVELPWLVSLGWYLAVLMYMDGAAAAAAV